MEGDALELLVTELFALSRLITPNIPEAELITGKAITSETDMLKRQRESENGRSCGSD